MFCTAPLVMHLILKSPFSLLFCIFITGSYDVGPQNQVRAFLSYQHCRESLDLTEGKTYLIMGTSKDIHRDEQNQS